MQADTVNQAHTFTSIARRFERTIGGLAFGTVALAALAVSGCGGDSNSAQLFEVVIENPSTQSTFIDQNGQAQAVVFSSAVAAVHDGGRPLYTLGEAARSNGIEALAEDGDAGTLGESLSFTDEVRLVGLATEIQSTMESSPLPPGEKYRLVLSADSEDAKLSLALSFLQGNDLIVATPESGIALFNGSTPITADITSQLVFLDVGTEVNQPPGLGADQPFRQAQPNTGAVEGGVVRAVDDGFNYPAVGSMIKVTVTAIGETE